MTKKRNPISRLLGIASDMGAWLLIIVVAIILTIFTDTFLTWDNIINVLRQTCVVSIIALGASFVVLGGEIDLSTGMASTFAGCNTALLMTKFNVPVVPAILIALAVGIVIGTITGSIVTFWRIPAFIGSLGIQYIIQGLILVTTGSMPVTGLPDSFLVLGRGYIANTIPVPVILMLVFFAIGAVVLKYTPFGRSVIVVGENPEAAKLSGLNVKKTKILIFTICGFCAAFAGIVQASRMSSGQPSSGGDLSLQALAAVYIGGTFKGSMLNTLAGALAWGFVNNGLNLLGVNAYWQKVALGVVIIIAVLFDIVRARAIQK
ncbi:MAG: ABC transporter permease [Oscillospiraceae bacterium]